MRDGVLHDLDDGGVPVAAPPVVEHAVAAGHEVVGVALREAGGELHGLAAGAAAVAVGDVHPRQGRHRGVRARVVHPDAQLAAPRVEEERARLEHRRPDRVVEVRERDEVAQQRPEVAVVVDEAGDVADGGRLGGEPLVAGQEGVEAGPRRAAEERAHPADAELLHLRAGLRREPRLVRREPGEERSPLVRRERGAVLPEQRRHGVAAERLDGRGPRRVHALAERERAPGLDPRERERGDVRGGGGEVLRGERRELRVAAVERRRGARLHRGEPAAHEEVVHLRPHRLDRRERGVRPGAEHPHLGARLAGLPPPRVRGGLGEEGLHARAVHPELSPAVGDGPQGGDDVEHGLAGLDVGRGVGGDDAVAVEEGLLEHPRGVRDVRGADRRRRPAAPPARARGAPRRAPPGPRACRRGTPGARSRRPRRG